MQQKRLIKLVLHIPIILLHQFDKTLLHQSKYTPMRHYAPLLTLTLRWAPRSAVACLPQRRCTKNFNVKNTEREIAPLEKTSGSA